MRDFFAAPLVSELPDGFGSKPNLIPRRFACGASFKATSAAANAKGTPEGVPFALCKGYEKDIFYGLQQGFELPRGLTNVGNTNLYNIFLIIHSDIFFCFSCFGDFSANKKCTFSIGWVSNLIVRESSTSANPRAV